MKPAGFLLENGSQRLLSLRRRSHRRARIAFRVGWPKTRPNLHLRFSPLGATAGNQRSATPRSATSRAALWLSRISTPPCSWVKSIPAQAGCKPPNPLRAEGGDQFVQLVGNGLHLGLRGRIGHRQAQRQGGDEPGAGVVEAVLDGLELAAHFARDER